MLSEAEILRNEIAGVAIHEAAHLALIIRFGGRGSIEIWRNPRGTYTEEKAILGRCTLENGPIVGSSQDQLVCLAGEVAERVWADPELDPGELFEAIGADFEDLSVSDREGIGNLTEGLTSECLYLVKSTWGEILQLAADAIRGFALDAQADDDQVAASAASATGALITSHC